MDYQAVSHYQIIKRLGAGGMGEIYLAEDSLLDRRVAIKFLPPDSVTDEQAKKRLIREAKAAARSRGTLGVLIVERSVDEDIQIS